MKVIAVNGSARKNFNTAKMLNSALGKAKELGCETELINLYDKPFKGCISCFACKLKNSKTNGLCAYKDDLRPILEKCLYADVIILGAPIYYDMPSGVSRSFLERLLFPIGSYHVNPDGTSRREIEKKIPIGFIYCMNCPEDYMDEVDYKTILKHQEGYANRIMGYAESLYCCNTYQFSDYSKYDFTLFTEEFKRKYRDEHFEIDLNNAKELAERLIKKANEFNCK